MLNKTPFYKKIALNSFSATINFFKNEKQIWLAFLIPYVIMLGAYLSFGILLTEKSVLALDLNAQYVSYFAYIKDVLGGDASLFYSWSRNLSGEFVGIIGYYLFSPFNWIVWAFPLEHITLGLLFMLVAKIGAAGLTMSIYLSKGRGLPKVASLLFSVMYALSAYNVVQTMNPMFLDGVIILPLIVMGIEASMREGRYKLLIFSLVYAFTTCFYIGYMLGIFSACYFIYYALTSRKASKENAVLILKRSGLFTIVAVIAVLCSCFMLLPVYSSLSLGKFGFSAEPNYAIRNSFNLLEISRKLLPDSYDTVRMDGAPFLYCGTLAIIMLPVYFLCGRIRRAKRVGGLVFIVALIICMYITPVDMFWHGMQEPNWIPYRYSFMLCFLILSFGADAFRHIKKIPYKSIGLSAAFFAGLMVYWEQADTFNPSLGNSGRDILNNLTVVIPALGILILLTSFVILAKNRLNKSGILGYVLIFLICGEMFYNAHYQLMKQDADIVYTSEKTFNSVMLPSREVVDEIKTKDDGFYRMGKTYAHSATDDMVLGMKGIHHSSSMLNTKAIEFLRKMGYSASGHHSRYSINTPLADDLFGFKYILSCLDDNKGYIKTKDDIVVTENLDAMPIAFIASSSLKNFALDDDDVFFNQSQLLSLMVGDTGAYKNDEDETYSKYFIRIDSSDITTDNLTFKPVGEGYDCYEKIDLEKEATIEFNLWADGGGDYYMYLPSGYERECELSVNGVNKGRYLDGDYHDIRLLGNYADGDPISVKLKLKEAKIFIRNERFVRFDKEAFEIDYAKLREMNVNTKFKAVSNTKLRIEYDFPEDCLLFASIPNEPGWKATVDGKPIQISALGKVQISRERDKPKPLVGALISAELPAGNHVIEMTFFPNYLPIGISLTILGISLIFLLNSIIFRINSKLKGEDGDEDIKNKKSEKDDYDGFDPDYIDYDDEYSDFNFDNKPYRLHEIGDISSKEISSKGKE